MTTYRNYAKENGHTDAEIEEMVEGLFGADAEMRFVKTGADAAVYDMGNGYTLFTTSSFDVVEHENGERWNLEY